MKPNMAAIAEYRKKVMYGKRLLLIFAMSRAWGVNLQMYNKINLAPNYSL